MKIEPESYCGILPNILINGGEGIGTGFSSSIPCYNPLDLIEYIKNRPFNDERYYISNNKLKELGWKIEKKFEKEIMELIK